MSTLHRAALESLQRNITVLANPDENNFYTPDQQAQHVQQLAEIAVEYDPRNR